jgi:Antidote-toxin recognition MazE, bacterial antitoxin
MVCPICGGRLRQAMREYVYEGIGLGEHEAEVCERCGEVFFTEEASDAIDRLAKEKGVWGLEARSKVSYSGNSLIVRIPKEIAEFMGLEKGTGVRLHPEGSRRLVVELMD